MNKIIICGYGDITCIGIEICQNLNINLPLIISDRKKNIYTPSLEKFCRTKKIPFVYTTNLNNLKLIDRIKVLKPTLILSLQPKSIIGKELISIPKYGVVNLHNAPLPLLRGCDPFCWAIHDGLLYMGVTLHKVKDKGIDNGPIINQRFWKIKETSTAWDLYRTSTLQAKILLEESIPKILSGSIKEIKQNEKLVTYHSKNQFDFKNLKINWEMPYNTLSSFIRSRIFPPLQLPYFSYKNYNFYIVKCRGFKLKKTIPGVIMAIEEKFISIGAKYGLIQIYELKMEDKKISIKKLVKKFNLKLNDSILEQSI